MLNLAPLLIMTKLVTGLEFIFLLTISNHLQVDTGERQRQLAPQGIKFEIKRSRLHYLLPDIKCMDTCMTHPNANTK